MSEVVGLAAAAKTSISEYYVTMGSMPTGAESAGVNTSAGQSTYVSAVAFNRTSSSVADVEYTLTNLVADVNTEVLEFQGTGSADGVQWVCNGAGTTVPAKFLPANCR